MEPVTEVKIYTRQLKMRCSLWC